jgi:hypothetical protein
VDKVQAKNIVRILFDIIMLRAFCGAAQSIRQPGLSLLDEASSGERAVNDFNRFSICRPEGVP